MKFEFSAYHYSPDVDDAPRIQDYTLEAEEGRDVMLLDALMRLKEKDPSLSFRRSCCERVCGSDGPNVNSKNRLTHITPISVLNQPDKKIVIRPLLGLPVVRGLVVDMGQFYAQYEKTKPYLLNNGEDPPVCEHLQIPEQREKLNGLHECILCACCSTFCPSFWWNPDKFIDPAGLLVAYRFLIDSCDTETDSRLEGLSDAFSIFHCRSIMNCVSVCPEGLNPTRVIGRIKSMLFRRSTQVVVVVVGWQRSVLSGLWVTYLVGLTSEAPSGNSSAGSPQKLPHYQTVLKSSLADADDTIVRNK